MLQAESTGREHRRGADYTCGKMGDSRVKVALTMSRHPHKHPNDHLRGTDAICNVFICVLRLCALTASTLGIDTPAYWASGQNIREIYMAVACVLRHNKWV